jgi:hypothetical protein
MTGPEYIWFYRLDGFGDEGLELHSCRRWVLNRFDPSVDSDYTLIYYLTPDGRWIECKGDQCPYDGEYVESYREIHPIDAARQFLRGLARANLPPELEEFREIASDSKLYFPWAEAQLPEFYGSQSFAETVTHRPIWDRDRKLLYLGSVVCLSYAREAGNQFRVLDAFQAKHWLGMIASPFPHETTLTQTLRDLHGKLGSQSLMRFTRVGVRVGWEPCKKRKQLP